MPPNQAGASSCGYLQLAHVVTYRWQGKVTDCWQSRFGSVLTRSTPSRRVSLRDSRETPTGYPSSVGSPSASPCVSGSFFLSQLFGNASRTLTMSNPSWPGGSAPRPPRLYAEDGGSRPTPCACSPWLAEPFRGCGDACFGASAPGRRRGVARIY